MKPNNEISILLEALKYFYPGYFGEEIRPTKSYFEYGGQKYKKGWVLSETFKITNVPENTSDVGVAIRELEKLNNLNVVEPPKSPVDASLPGKGLSKQQIENMERVEAQKIEIKERVGVKTQAEIAAKLKAAANNKRLRDFKEAAKNAAVNAEVKNQPKPQLSEKQEQILSDLKAEAINNPDDLKAQVAAEAQTKLKEMNIPNATDEQILAASELTAENTVAALAGRPPIVEARVLKESLNSPVLASIADQATLKLVANYSDLQLKGALFSRSAAELVFGDVFTNAIYETPLSVRISETPTPTSTPFEVSRLVNTEYKPVFTDKAVKPTINPYQRSELTNFKSSLTNFKQQPKVGGQQQAKTPTQGPRIYTTNTFLRNTLSQVGNSIANLGSSIKILASSNLEGKQGLMIVGGAVAAIAGISTGSPVITVLGSGSVVTGFTVNPARVFSGSAFGSIVEPVLGVLHSIMGFVISGIVLPIILAVLCVPLLVGIFLFIINSGAYVVPPSPYDITGSLGGIDVVCTNEKGPVIDSETDKKGPQSSSEIANRAWEITYDLYQGFWCYWNRSPKAPPQYFPNDLPPKYPDGYPETFDYEAFKRSPNTTPPSGNLFWCTYLVIKSYSETGNSMIFTESDGNSQSMFDNFNKNKRVVLPNKATPSNIVPGSVVFFQVHGPGHPDRINHVGIVYSVDPGGLVFVESNAGLKSQSLNYKSGVGFESIGPMELKGFGLP